MILPDTKFDCRGKLFKKYINSYKWMQHNSILAQISKPPPSVFGNISGILKGTFMKYCINDNESMSCVSVKNIYSNMAI